jgi:hypothetical protein
MSSSEYKKVRTGFVLLPPFPFSPASQSGKEQTIRPLPSGGPFCFNIRQPLSLILHWPLLFPEYRLCRTGRYLPSASAGTDLFACIWKLKISDVDESKDIISLWMRQLHHQSPESE